MIFKSTRPLVAGLTGLILSAAVHGESVIVSTVADAAGTFEAGPDTYRALRQNDTSILVGRQGAAAVFHQAAVFPFQLPDFGAVTEPFGNAQFQFRLNAKESVENFNVDLYGLPARTSSTVLPVNASTTNPGDFFMGGFAGGPADDPTPGVVKIQDNILTVNTSAGIVTTNVFGGNQLAAYLNAAYDSGNGAGKWVFLRLSTDAVPGGVFRYSVAATNNSNEDYHPRIRYNFEPEPDPVVRPMIWVRDSEKAAILDKIANHVWAASLLNSLQSRMAGNLANHQADRDAYIRELPVDWNLSPARYRTTQNHTESQVRGPSESKFNAALDCAVLYYLTGDEAYAALAGDILHNVVNTLLQAPASTSVGNGGWIFFTDLLKGARIVGTQLPIVYDFLYEYLKANQVYDVQSAGMVGFDHSAAQAVFRKYYELTRDHGQTNNNWSALMATCMLNNLLALNDEAEREAALQVYITTGGPRQDSLAKDYQNYTQPGDVWPESLQYANGVANIRATHMVLIERYDPARNLFNAYPNLPLSLPRVSELVYPNGQLIRFGDGQRTGGSPPYFRYDLVYQHALARGRTGLTDYFGPLINAGIQSGAYDRSNLGSYSSLGQHDDLLKLLWSAPEIAGPPGEPELPRADRLPFAGITLQRNPAPDGDPAHGLMGFVGGAGFVHSNASGMNIELYGLGHVLGAKGGRDAYGSAIHNNYYRLFAAHNTVIVNGGSRGSGGWQQIAINTVQNVAMEPQAFAPAVSPNHSFSVSSFIDDKGTLAQGTQQRTLAVVRTSPTSGFYVDFFRTRSTVTNRTATTLNGNVTNQYHDYIYRNVGNLNPEVLVDGSPAAFFSQPGRFENDIGDSYQQPGWRYFENTRVTYPANQSLRARFVATVSGLDRCMTMHMPATATREIAMVESPRIVDAPGSYGSAKSPTLVIRQIGDTWDRPFAAVYEPHFGAGGGSVQNVTNLERDGMVVGVKIESAAGGNNAVHYVLANPAGDQVYEDPAIGLSFTGRFAIVADFGDGLVNLYLGQGRSLSYMGYAMATANGLNSQGEARFAPGQDPDVTANTPVNVTSTPMVIANWLRTDGNPDLDWNDNANWDSTTWPNAADKIASMNVDLDGDQIVNLNVPIKLGQLVIGDNDGGQSMRLQKGFDGTLTFERTQESSPAYITRSAGGTGDVTFHEDLDFILNNDLIVRSGGGAELSTMVVAGDISSSGRGIIKESDNLVLNLTADNSLSGPVVIDGGALLLGNGGETGSLPGVSAITINNGVLAVNRSDTFTQAIDLNGTVISGAGGFSHLGTGTTILGAANTLTGPTSVSAGTLRLAASQALSSGDLSVDGLFDLNGHDQTSGSLSGDGIIDNTAADTSATLVLNTNSGITFNGILRNSGPSATLNLVKIGTGVFTLGGQNTLGGLVAINGGTLAFTQTAPLHGAGGILLAGGTTLRPDVVGGIITAPVTVGASGTTATITAPSIVGAGGTNPVPVTLSGGIHGAGDVRFLGIENTNAYGHVILNAPSTYAGSTLLTTTGGNRNIFVRLGAENALPVTTVVTLDGGNGTGGGRFCDINLSGYGQTLAGLTNVDGRTLRSQRIRNTSPTPATLTIDNTADFTFGGQLGNTGTNLNLAKSGPGTQTLSGSLAYAGDTTVHEGTLVLGSINPNISASAVTIAESAATLELAFADTQTVDKLFIGTTQQPAGIYGALGSADPVIGIPQITGMGTLTVTSEPEPAGGYDAWAAANAGGQGPGLDYDHDGVPNGIEYVLGGDSLTNDLDKLPVVSVDDGHMVFSFIRDQASIDGTTEVVIEAGHDLVNWPITHTVPDTAVANTPGLTVIKDSPAAGWDTVILILPLNPGESTFARLKVTP